MTSFPVRPALGPTHVAAGVLFLVVLAFQFLILSFVLLMGLSATASAGVSGKDLRVFVFMGFGLLLAVGLMVLTGLALGRRWLGRLVIAGWGTVVVAAIVVGTFGEGAGVGAVVLVLPTVVGLALAHVPPRSDAAAVNRR